MGKKDNDNIDSEVNQVKNNDGVDNYINDMISDVPEIQQHVVDAEKNKTEKLNNSTDESGEVFNDKIHISKDGKPSLTKTGKFRKKKKINDSAVDNKVKEDEQEKLVNESMASAVVVQGMKRSIYSEMFGYKYNDAQHNICVEATNQYFISSGGVKLTPLQLLIVLETQMAIGVIKTEKGSKKINNIKAWVASKYIKFKGKKKNDAHINNRSNDVGKNDISS